MYIFAIFNKKKQQEIFVAIEIICNFAADN